MGADINAIDHMGRSALYYAAMPKLRESVRHSEVLLVEELLKRSANPLPPDLSEDLELFYSCAGTVLNLIGEDRIDPNRSRFGSIKPPEIGAVIARSQTCKDRIDHNQSDDQGAILSSLGKMEIE